MTQLIGGGGAAMRRFEDLPRRNGKQMIWNFVSSVKSGTALVGLIAVRKT